MKGGEGWQQITTMIEQDLTLATIAERLGCCYSTVTRVSMKYGRKVRRRSRSSLPKWKRLAQKAAVVQDHELMLRTRDTQEVEFDDAPIFKRYGPAGGYASVPSHRSRSEGMP